MKTQDFETLTTRASSSLTEQDLRESQTVNDVEQKLDEKFFRGWGDRRTRFGVTLKRLVADHVVKQNQNVIGTAGVEEPGAIAVRADSIIGRLRSIPIIKFIRNRRRRSSLRLLSKLKRLGGRNRRQSVFSLIKRRSRKQQPS